MTLRRPVMLAAVVVVVLFAGGDARPAAPPAAGYKNGAVAADHLLASRAGVEILRQGGNAVDAACAAAFTLGVVSPAGSGIGGGGFLLLWRAGAPPVVLDFRETAPGAARRDMYARPGVPESASRRGGLAVAVPGELAGCAEAVRRFGRLDLARVLAPAIRHARRGFPVGLHLARTVRATRGALAADGGLARLFLPGGEPVSLDQLVRRPALARSLESIAREGTGVVYGGRIGRQLVEEVRRRGGLLSLDDLRRYRVKERQPLRGTYRGLEVWGAPPPSSGGVALVEMLNVLGHYPLASLGQDSSGYLHLLAEAMKHAFADRARFLGDPDFVAVPVGRLTSPAYAVELARRIGERTAAPRDYGARPEPPSAPSGGRHGTSHISVVDRFGNAVALTTTINLPFGAGFEAGSTGIIPNDEMDDFATRPGRPNAFGLVQSERNAVAPGKRPVSSMCPTVVVRHGRPVLVSGASGGPTIISATLQTVLNVIDFKLAATDAVYRSRIHDQWLPDELWVEDDLPRDVTEALARRGHHLKRVKEPFTAAQVVVVGEGGVLYPASDPRKAGAPAGY